MLEVVADRFREHLRRLQETLETTDAETNLRNRDNLTVRCAADL